MMPMEPSSATEKKLTRNVEVGTLCAFYGGLLTERQRAALQLHYDEDWSLAEIAEQMGVSRQNVHDLIARSVQKLQHYEAAVGGVAQARRISTQLHRAAEALERAQSLAGAGARDDIREAAARLQQTMTDIDGEE